MSEWRPVVDLRGGYALGFDRHRTYEFKRTGDDKVHQFRMADMHPYFNIAGLFWRDPIERAAPMTEREKIVSWLRLLSRTASSEQAAGAYAYAADEIERGAFRAAPETSDGCDAMPSRPEPHTAG